MERRIPPGPRQFAYGSRIEHRDLSAFFRANEIDSNYNSGIFGTAFANIAPARAPPSPSTSTICSTPGSAQPLVHLPQPLQSAPSRSPNSRAQQSRQLRADLKRTFAARAGGDTGRRHGHLRRTPHPASRSAAAEISLSYTPPACHALFARSLAPALCDCRYRAAPQRPVARPYKWSLTLRL